MSFDKKPIKTNKFYMLPLMDNDEWFEKEYVINENGDKVINGYLLKPDAPDIARDIYNDYYDLVPFPKTKLEELEKHLK